MNTKNKGSLEFYVYKEKSGDYCAICLTLNLIEWGKDPKKLMNSINEAAISHIVGVIKKGLSDELLNRPAPDKYWLMARKNVNIRQPIWIGLLQ